MDLKTVPLFKGLPTGELKLIERELSEVRHPAGHRVMRKGANGVAFMVILEGEAEVKTTSGRTVRLKPGDHFGEVALLDRRGRSADVVASTDLVVRAVAEWAFRPFLMAHPEVSYRLLQALSRRLRDAESA